MERLLVDFNDMRDGRYGGLVEDLTGPARLGDMVTCHDLDNEVDGLVVRVYNGVVSVRPYMETWR